MRPAGPRAPRPWAPPARPRGAALALALAAACCALLAGAARAADPALAAGARAGALADPSADPAAAAAPPLALQEAARAAAAAARARAGAVVSSALPAPHYSNYSLAASRDTFEICKTQSGLKREISLEELLPIYGLPRELLARRRVALALLSDVLAASAPSARLVIAPLLAGEAELAPVLHPGGGLPRLVHFTVRDKASLLPHQALAVASWARLNPGYSILLYDDADISEFMATYHPRHVPLFESLGSQVERTDLWRYLVLCTFGGVYADSDVVAGRPVSTWAADAGLLTGVENVFESMAAARRRDYTGVMQVVQWVIAARPGHEALCQMGDYVSKFVAAEAAAAAAGADEPDRDHAILERTGPGIWSRSVHDYIRARGVQPESLVGGGKVGDLRLLPQSTFGCASSTVNLADPMAYAYHMFKGSWRLREPGRIWQFVTHLYAHLFETPAPAPAAAGGSGKGGAGASPGVGSGGAAAAGGEGRRAAGAGGGDATTGAAPGVRPRERRLRAQVPTEAAAAGGALLLRDAGAGAPHPREGLHLLPVASVLVLAALVCSALVHRGGGGGRCSGARAGAGGGGGGGGAAARVSGGGAAAAVLAGIWGGARRAVGGPRSSGGACSAGGAAPLLPLSQPPGGLPPKGAAAAAAAAPERAAAGGGLARQPGSSSGGCLKRAGGSAQCLHGGGSGGGGAQ